MSESIAEALKALARKPNGKAATPPPSSKPSRKEIRSAVKAMRSATSDDDALDAYLTLHNMMKDYE